MNLYYRYYGDKAAFGSEQMSETATRVVDGFLRDAAEVLRQQYPDTWQQYAIVSLTSSSQTRFVVATVAADETPASPAVIENGSVSFADVTFGLPGAWASYTVTVTNNGTVNANFAGAAIALDTVERRARTGKTGTALYLASGMDQLLHHLDCHRYTASFDGGEPVRGASFTFAVQVGPTYGGGFRICPDARIDDGLLDVCIAHPPFGIARAVFVFLLAKGGRHTGFRQIELRRARTLSVRFDAPPPVQIDGEPLEASEYAIDVVPRALDVLVPETPA